METLTIEQVAALLNDVFHLLSPSPKFSDADVNFFRRSEFSRLNRGKLGLFLSHTSCGIEECSICCNLLAEIKLAGVSSGANSSLIN